MKVYQRAEHDTENNEKVVKIRPNLRYYMYSLMIKSFLPYSRCLCSDDEYERYK